MSTRACPTLLLAVFGATASAQTPPSTTGAAPTAAASAASSSDSSGSQLLLNVSVDDRAARTLQKPRLRIGGIKQVELRDDGNAPDALANDHLFTGQVMTTRATRTEIAVLESVYGSPYVLGSGNVVMPDVPEDVLTVVIPPSGAGTFEARFSSASTDRVEGAPQGDASGPSSPSAPQSGGGGGGGHTSSEPVALERLDPWPLLIGLLVLIVLVRVWLARWYRHDLGPLTLELRRYLARRSDTSGRPFQAERFLEAVRARETTSAFPWVEHRPVLLLAPTKKLREALSTWLALDAVDRGSKVVVAGQDLGDWTLAERAVRLRTGEDVSVNSVRVAMPLLQRLDSRSASGSLRPLEAREALARLQGSRGALIFEGLPAGAGDPVARADAALMELGAVDEELQVVLVLGADLLDPAPLRKAIEGDEVLASIAALAESLGGVGVVEEAAGQVRITLTLRSGAQTLLLSWDPTTGRLAAPSEPERA